MASKSSVPVCGVCISSRGTPCALDVLPKLPQRKHQNLPSAFKSNSVVAPSNYTNSGRQDGHDLEDWPQAESELVQQRTKAATA
jgi:hypothetical protein